MSSIAKSVVGKSVTGLAAVTAAMFATAAVAVPLSGGETRVVITAEIEPLGLTPGTLGSASVINADPLTVGFPISGGDIAADLSSGQILHEGSGISLTDGVELVSIENLIIDLEQSSILADVSFGDTSLIDIAVFSFDLTTLGEDDDVTDLEDPDISLFLTADAGGLFAELFDVIDLSGEEIAVAATAPEFADVDVPAPAALALFGLGLGLLGLRRRR
ncbi:MAG: PEP-CTERM sorting domain-containing protein [Pseudomonadota bacterium]